MNKAYKTLNVKRQMDEDSDLPQVRIRKNKLDHKME
jgi:hypothetical protein